MWCFFQLARLDFLSFGPTFWVHFFCKVVGCLLDAFVCMLFSSLKLGTARHLSQHQSFGSQSKLFFKHTCWLVVYTCVVAFLCARRPVFGFFCLDGSSLQLDAKGFSLSAFAFGSCFIFARVRVRFLHCVSSIPGRTPVAARSTFHSIYLQFFPLHWI